MPLAPSGATPLNAPLILPSPSIQLARTPVNSPVLLPLPLFPAPSSNRRDSCA